MSKATANPTIDIPPDAGGPFVLVTGEDVEVTTFANVISLRDRLSTLIGDAKQTPLSTKAIIVQGRRVFMSRGAFKYLLFEDAQIPIHPLPGTCEPDESGFLVDVFDNHHQTTVLSETDLRELADAVDEDDLFPDDDDDPVKEDES